MKHKVELRDSVSAHMKRELSWRRTILLSVFMISIGIGFIWTGSNYGYIYILNFPIKYIGFIIVAITGIFFLLSLLDRRWFKKNYEYMRKN